MPSHLWGGGWGVRSWWAKPCTKLGPSDYLNRLINGLQVLVTLYLRAHLFALEYIKIECIGCLKNEDRR